MTGMILALAMCPQQTRAPVPKLSGPIEVPGVMYPGLRDLPQGTLPVAQYGVPNLTGTQAVVTISPQQAASFDCGIAGFEIPIKQAELSGRYKSVREYQKLVSQRLKELIKSGWFLPLYSKQVESDRMAVQITGGSN